MKNSERHWITDPSLDFATLDYGSPVEPLTDYELDQDQEQMDKDFQPNQVKKNFFGWIKTRIKNKS